MCRFTWLILLLTTLTTLVSSTTTQETTSGPASLKVHSLVSRGIGRVPNLHRTAHLKSLNGGGLVNALKADGELWIAQLNNARRHPPPALTNPTQFLNRYYLKEDTVPYATFSGVRSGSSVDAERDSLYHELVMKPQRIVQTTPRIIREVGQIAPYTLLLSQDQRTLVIKEAFSKYDNPPFYSTPSPEFEDIVSYEISYMANSQNLNTQRSSTLMRGEVARAVGNIRNIVRDLINNEETIRAIQAVFANQRWSRSKRWRKVPLDSDDFKALIATRNGTLAIKILGTNMATNNGAEIIALYIYDDGITRRMLFKFNMLPTTSRIPQRFKQACRDRYGQLRACFI